MSTILQQKTTEINDQFHSFLTQSYKNTAVGLFLTLLISFLLKGFDFLNYDTVIKISIIGIVFFVIAFVASILIDEISQKIALWVFYLFSILMGYCGSTFIYTMLNGIMFQILAINLCMFLGMYILGSVTNINIISINSYMIMFLVGLFVASVLSIYANGWFILLILMSYVIIYTGLAIFYTQTIINFHQTIANNQKKKFSMILIIFLYFSFLTVILAIIFILKHINKKNLP